MGERIVPLARATVDFERDTKRISVCLAGTWDTNFGRNIILQRILKRAGCEVTTCQVDLWGERRDAIVRTRKLAIVRRAIVAYPLLIWKFLRSPRSDIVLVPYPGYFDMLLIATLCRIRGTPVVFDIFISLYDTVVSDRGLTSRASLLATLMRAADRMACRASDLVLADTPADAEYFAELTGVPLDRFRVLWVGAREHLFHPVSSIDPDPNLVLFYGTFIPLHGLETIVRAAKRLELDGIRFRIIGDGQKRNDIDQLISELHIKNIERVGLIPLECLRDEIAGAGICLGIFGTTAKASRVVPNKVYECIAIGRPVVTADTPAIHSAFNRTEVQTVPPGDADQLANAIRCLRAHHLAREQMAIAGRERFRRDYSEDALSRLLISHLDELLKARAERE